MVRSLKKWAERQKITLEEEVSFIISLVNDGWNLFLSSDGLIVYRVTEEAVIVIIAAGMNKLKDGLTLLKSYEKPIYSLGFNIRNQTLLGAKFCGTVQDYDVLEWWNGAEGNKTDDQCSD